MLKVQDTRKPDSYLIVFQYSTEDPGDLYRPVYRLPLTMSTTDGSRKQQPIILYHGQASFCHGHGEVSYEGRVISIKTGLQIYDDNTSRVALS